MIDFIKIQYTDKSKLEPFVMSGENFDEVKGTFNFQTGEIGYPYKAKLDETMDIKICMKSGFVQNSIHKLYNQVNEKEQHNYNDFKYSNLVEVLDYMSSKLIDSTKVKITNMEFGLNIRTDVSAEELVENNVFTFKDKNYNSNREFGGKGKLKQFTYTDYLIKIYDKAKQYKRPGNILRFEIKFTRARSINKFGIYCLDDLRDKELLRDVFNHYLVKFDELLIIDSQKNIRFDSEAHKTKWLKYSNPDYWEKEVSFYSRQTKMNHKKEFLALIEHYGLNSTQEKVRNSLIEKFNFLISN